MANKSLNLSNLKKLNAELNQAVEITLSTGNTLQIDKHFRNSVIEKVFEKLMNVQNIINQNKDDDKSIDFPLEKYTVFLMMLNFTSLKNIKCESLSKEIQIMNMLIDLGIYKEILEKMEEHCGEEIKKFNSSIVNIMQEKLESLKAQEQFMSILNDEIEKVKVEQSENNIDEVIEEGDENSQFGEPIEENREEITTEN